MLLPVAVFRLSRPGRFRPLPGTPGRLGLLLLQDISLLLGIGHLTLPFLLLLEGDLPLILLRLVLRFPPPADDNLSCGEIPDPPRRQVHRQQNARRHRQKQENASQHRPHQIPEGIGQQDPQISAAGLQLNALQISLMNHPAPAAVRNPGQHGQIFLVSDPCHQDNKGAQCHKSHRDEDERPHRRFSLAAPDHQHARPDGENRSRRCQTARQAVTDLPQHRKNVPGHPHFHRQEHHDSQGDQHQPRQKPQGQGIRRIDRLSLFALLSH